MVAEVKKIDSNVTGLRIAAETSLGVLGGSPVFYELEPNSYSDFGGQLTTIARNPINPRRTRRKGVVTDLDASAGFNNDLTQAGLSFMWEKVFLAKKRKKAHNARNVPGVNDLVDVSTDGTAPAYQVATGDGAKYRVNDLIYASGFPEADNNGLKVVTAVTGDRVRAAGLVNNAAPPDGASIRIVGHQFAAGDLQVIKNPNELPILRATAKDVTQLNLIPGEWMYIGGDDFGATGDAFDAAHNRGFARVARIEGTQDLRLDKTSGGADGVTEMVTEAGGTKAIKLFFGDIIRNESALSTEFLDATSHIERTLGKPRPVANPTEVQSELQKGAVLNGCQFNIAQADKITVDFTFISTDNEQRDGTTGSEEPVSTIGGAVVVQPVTGDAFNTSSDFSRLKMAIVPTDTGSGALAAPQPLFAFVTEATFAISNNATANKAVTRLGAFAVTAGTFEVGGSLTAYFADVAAVKAVRNNSDVTIDWVVVKDYLGRKAGLLMDIPLLALGDGRLNVEQNQPITLPLSITDGEYIPFGHSCSLTEFWYLPNTSDV